MKLQRSASGLVKSLVGIALVMSFGFASIDEVMAEDDKKKTRRVPAISQSLYKQMSEAQVMIDPDSIPREEGEPAPEPKGTPQDGIQMLLDMTKKRKLNSNELSQLWNLLAFGYYTLEDVPNTIYSYEQVLAAGKVGLITEALEKNSLRALFQLNYSIEKYELALKYIDLWEAVNGAPDAAVSYLKATANYQLERFEESLKWALQVEEIIIAEGREMKENWVYLQVVLYSELKDDDNVIRVLERMVVDYPKKQYWMHLAGMYTEKEWDDRALSAYYAIYSQGMFEKDSEIVMLSQRLLNAEVPYEAAIVLEKGIKDKLVETSEKNLRLLATCYTVAQEMSKAIDAWERATKSSEDGDIQYRLAQALAQQDRHKEAVGAYRQALEDDELKSPSDAHFWMAISHMSLENWDQASTAFKAASKLDKKIAKQARQYIRYIAGEKRRQAALKEMLEG
ncbi:tetratricopeptide repeat protein [Pseudomonadales bacterium]|nr:tetratricopeptide repeat protein [Pseudomonadales bacterium]